MAVILLFEDEKILRENIQELIEAHGYVCICAAHGKGCLKLILKTKPDLILCDISLPFLSGYAIKKQLNKNSKLANIPFIFLSAKIEAEDKEKGLELGADDYIVKPFVINTLINSIKKTLICKKFID